MRPHLDHFTTGHDRNSVCPAYRAQSVGDHNSSTAALLEEFVYRFLDQSLAFSVERRRSLIKEQNARLLNQRTCNRDPLFLPSG
jgi:hypothetical protein